ncbi:radical SAM family heme chaperone HemW [Azoarcus taiwanensis]|uniref:Heme chaperone HemW n=1 Tax=Azoarcus taiwanensis TaxID=666964 RepID=A0A972F716_9RHOO|nr:oxygen-independent coproporphyrinogen III oxidase-like protein [Azoarcus taiwanensis]
MTRKTIPITPAHAVRLEPAGTGQRIQLTASPPLALYIHYPWCVRKCPYCDFNSHTLRGDATPDTGLEARYIDALVADIESALPQVWGRRVHTVFIGGGTPSLMSAPALDRLLTAVRTLLPLDPMAEITLEANPGTFEAARFRDYRAAGVNRLSIGIQSFDDAALTRIGRIHDADQARRAVDIALTNFERVNLDIMYALPEQNMAAAMRDIDIAIATGVSHVSAYHLTLEPNTAFAHSPPPLPDSDLSADMQEAIEDRLAAAGFEHYETSAFARPGQQCRHNLNYWQFGDYLGIGAGAHGKLSSHEGIVREMRHKHPTRYLEAAARRDFVQERREVAAAELPFEFLMNALRLTDGVPTALFSARTGLPLSVIADRIDQAVAAGLLAADPLTLRPTEQGQRFLNDLLALFLPEAEAA